MGKKRERRKKGRETKGGDRVGRKGKREKKKKKLKEPKGEGNREKKEV